MRGTQERRGETAGHTLWGLRRGLCGGDLPGAGLRGKAFEGDTRFQTTGDCGTDTFGSNPGFSEATDHAPLPRYAYQGNQTGKCVSLANHLPRESPLANLRIEKCVSLANLLSRICSRIPCERCLTNDDIFNLLFLIQKVGKDYFIKYRRMGNIRFSHIDTPGDKWPLAVPFTTVKTGIAPTSNTAAPSIAGWNAFAVSRTGAEAIEKMWSMSSWQPVQKYLINQNRT